jgi:hypothetical protein
MSIFVGVSPRLGRGPHPHTLLLDACKDAGFRPVLTWLQPHQDNVAREIRARSERTGVAIVADLGIIRRMSDDPTDVMVGWKLQHADTGRSFVLSYHRRAGEYGGKITGGEFREFVMSLPEIKRSAHEAATSQGPNTYIESMQCFMQSIPIAPFSGKPGRISMLTHSSNVDSFRSFAQVMDTDFRVEQIRLTDVRSRLERSLARRHIDFSAGLRKTIFDNSHAQLEEQIRAAGR